MAKRQIVQDEEFLRKASKPVTDFNDRLRELIEDMKETMKDADGAGLAAVQVGVLRRVLVVDTGEQAYEIVNPTIVERSGHETCEEGCLSFPGVVGYVTRPTKVVVEGFDPHGNPIRVEGEGLMARALCHETDHLDGKVFVDLFVDEDDLEDILEEEEE